MELILHTKSVRRLVGYGRLSGMRCQKRAGAAVRIIATLHQLLLTLIQAEVEVAIVTAHSASCGLMPSGNTSVASTGRPSRSVSRVERPRLGRAESPLRKGLHLRPRQQDEVGGLH